MLFKIAASHMRQNFKKNIKADEGFAFLAEPASYTVDRNLKVYVTKWNRLLLFIGR